MRSCSRSRSSAFQIAARAWVEALARLVEEEDRR
jgi:hypothetical protein